MGRSEEPMSSVLVVDFSEVGRNPLNPLGRALRSHIWRSLEEAERNSSIKSVVLTGGRGGNFSAGADLTEFGSFKGLSSSTAPTADTCSLPDLVSKIERFGKPVVAAISGNALGGGFEVALSCHYRIADGTANLGLPEVNVGVIPGAGGTQRLPRIVGVKKALEMITTGSFIRSDEASKLGLLDQVVGASAKTGKNFDQLLLAAKKWALWAELMPLEDRRVGNIPLKEKQDLVNAITSAASKKVPSSEKGGQGVQAAIRAIRAASLPIEQGTRIEMEQFLGTLKGSQGKARRHIFFAVRQAQKPVHPSALPRNHKLLQKSLIGEQAAVVGAGLMGSGIALVLMQAGLTVHLYDISKPSLEKGVAFLRGTIASYVKRGKMTDESSKKILSLLKPTMRLEDLSGCCLVVEAVIERLNVKKSIFASLDKITPPDAILLSNTSTLDIDEMASAISPARRGQFAGWHFFSPAHVMKLVEIVVGRETSPAVVSVLQLLTKRIKKIGVVVGNCDGFVGNRLLISYGGETSMLLEEGVASVSLVDKALVNFGMALGPFQMSDLAGLDVGYNVRVERGWTDPSSPNRPKRYGNLADDVVAKLGRLGQKSGKGWYDYDPKIGKGRKPLPSKEMDEFVRNYAKKGQKTFSEEEVIERVLFPLVNEGFKCLEEGIALKPSDIDVVYVYGYGWPVYRGGPMYWADHEVGLPHLLARLKTFSQQFPTTNYYQPSNLLEECVRRGLTVEKYYAMGLQQKNLSKL